MRNEGATGLVGSRPVMSNKESEMETDKDKGPNDEPRGRVRVDALDEPIKELDENEAKQVKGGVVGTFTNTQPSRPKPVIGTFT